MTENLQGELKIKHLIVSVKNWSSYFFTFWKLIVAVAFIGAITGLVVAIYNKPVYLAELTFALEEKGGGSSYSGIASQLGLDIGISGSGGGAFSGENIIELLKSRSLIENTLLTSVVINGKKELLVNRFIDFNGWRSYWEDRPDLKGILYLKNEPREQFGIKKDSILAEIYRHIKQKSLNVVRIDKKLAIIKIEFKSNDEIFAKLFIEELIDRVSSFYIQTKTQRSRINLDILEARLDSVKRELDEEIYGAAVSKDRNMMTVRAEANVQTAKKQLNVQVLSTMYSELIKNTEMTKLALLRDEPLVQIIDRPILPLERERKGKLACSMTGGFLGGFLVLLILWLKRILVYVFE